MTRDVYCPHPMLNAYQNITVPQDILLLSWTLRLDKRCESINVPNDERSGSAGLCWEKTKQCLAVIIYKIRS